MNNQLEPEYLTEEELNNIEENKSLVLWGAGVLGEKTLNILHKDPICFLDNNPKLQGTSFHGVPVKSPEEAIERVEEKDAFLVICVQKHQELSEFLKENGIEYGSECAITPMSLEYKVLDDLRNHRSKVIFSNYDEEGGLYVYDFKENDLEKVFHGSVRGFTRVEDEIICASKRGIHRLDANNFEELETNNIGQYEVCGVAYDPDSNKLILGNTQTDEVSFINYTSLEIEESLSLSDRYENTGEEQHHINDIMVMEDQIFASVFSLSGWWRRGLFDGGVFLIDKQTKEIDKYQAPDLWMPHSITENNGDLYVLDSMNGELLKGFERTKAEFQGFVRGLEFNDKFCYIGQSLHRHVSRMENQLTTQISPGIHIVDLDNGASHFVPIPGAENIYNIEVADWL